MTRQLLWTEYVEAAQTREGEKPPYQYTQLCEHYHRWRGRLDLVMRQTHRAGEKAFIDYSGKGPSIRTEWCTLHRVGACPLQPAIVAVDVDGAVSTTETMLGAIVRERRSRGFVGPAENDG